MLEPVKRACDRTLSLVRKVDWIGPLVVRLTLALVFIPTGWGKLHDLEDVTAFFTQLGIPAPGFHAVFVSMIELVGGTMILFGLGTRIASALLIGVMAVAIYTAKLPELHGVVDLAGTIEFTYLAMFAWLAVSGGGKASLDHAAARLMTRSHAITPS
jgi:putative oxidoreductase